MTALSLGVIAALLTAGSLPAEQPRIPNRDYLIESWLANEGLPENCALTMAQTPDGYLWVGTSSGLLRFNGHEFSPVAAGTDLRRLAQIITCLRADQAGRLWVATDSGIAVLDHGQWRRIASTNVQVRSMGEAADGTIYFGTLFGELFKGVGDTLQRVALPARFTASGVFCCTDLKDGQLWVANRGFVGRLTASGWQRFGPTNAGPPSLVAAPARHGGLWVYTPGQVSLYRPDGSQGIAPAPGVAGPRWLTEDRNGFLWLATMPGGVIRFKPGGEPLRITTTNGLSHDAALFVFEDAEASLWVGSTSGGLQRLRPRQFQNIGFDEGLPDQIVRSVTEESAGRILVGTHGGGAARIENDKVTWRQPLTSQRPGPYAWSVLRDKAGRVWAGYYHDGLFAQENGVWRSVPLSPSLERTVYALFEDSHARLWVGAAGGLGRLERDRIVPWSRDKDFTPLSVRCIAEVPRTNILWIGTHARGLWRLQGEGFTRVGMAQGLPAERISSLHADGNGWVWAGVFGHGLVCLHDGKLTRVGGDQGLPAETIGAILEDGLGWFWLGSNRGILRVSRQDLERVVRGERNSAQVQVFNRSDGLRATECSEGHQPAAARGRDGRLWFATLSGVVSVNPRTLQLNGRPPPVRVERVTFTDRGGARQELLDPRADALTLPAGSRNLQIQYAALSYAAPEKNRFAYRLAGRSDDWLDMGTSRRIRLPGLTPGSYRLQIKAANNDGLWNETGTTLAFTVQPFVWQTLWFRTLASLSLVAGLGFATWRIARAQLRRQIERLQQQRAVEQEHARLAAVMETTSDLVFFADAEGRVLHINPAGRERLCLPAGAPPGALRIADLHAATVKEQILREAIPTAISDGTWEGDTSLKGADGREIPVSEVIVAHRDAAGRLSQLSGIARDILDRKRAENALRESEGKLRSILKVAPVGVGAVVNRVITEVNDRICEMTGYNREELLGASSRRLYPMQEDYDYVGAEKYRQISEHGTGTVETRWQRKDGTVIDVLLSSTPVDGSDLARGVIFTALDITERKRAEAALRESEARLRASLENTPNVGVQWFDEAGRVLFWNGACESIFGWPASEALGKTLDQLMHTPGEAARFVALLQELKRTNRSDGPVEVSFRRRDGRDGICLSTLFPIPSREGKATFVCMDVDITEGKRAETALREKSEELDRYFTSSLDLLCIADTDGYFHRLNPEWARVLGHPLPELLSRRFLDLVHPDDLAPTMAAVAQLGEQSEVLNFVNRYRCQDGSYRWLEWRSYPRGRLIYAIARDITERKSVEDLLQKLATAFFSLSSEELFFRVGSHLAATLQMEYVCVGELTPDQKRVVVRGGVQNGQRLQRFEYALAGTPCEQVAGRNLCVFPRNVRTEFPDDRLLGDLGAESYIGCPLFDHTGQPLGVCVALSKQPLKEAPLARTLFKLVTSRLEAELEHRRAEDEKARLQAQLIQAHKMESVGRLAGGVAHDFNNMLQVILGNAALALSRTRPDDPLHGDLLEIEKSARRSADLTRQLLAFARKQTVNPRILDLNETIAGMLKMLHRLMGEDIELKWLPGSSLWPVKMDPAQVDQVLANLAANARDAIPGAGRVTIETCNVTLDAVSLQTQPDCGPGEYVMLAVSDSGRGMTPEVREHLFEPFFTTKEVGKGTGLGLATVFGIVKQNHGFINVYSEPDHGTTLKIYLPRAEGASDAGIEPPAQTPNRGAETVLLVEDEEQILGLGQRILQQHGYTVLAARSAEDAIRIARQFHGRIHLLITDVVMPGLNGKQLKQQIEDGQPQLKCLFMSGYTADVIAHHGVLDEGVHFLQKPFTLAALTAKVRELLDLPGK